MEFNIISDNILSLKGDVVILDSGNNAQTNYENTVFISFPTKDTDDDENTKLESAYIKSILEATTYPNATINVPVIDNGYGEKVVFDMVREVIASIIDSNDTDEEDRTTINLVLPKKEFTPKAPSDGLKKFASIPDFRQNAVPSTKFIARTSDGVILDVLSANDAFTLKQENGDIYIPDATFTNPYKFIEFVMSEKGIKSAIFTRNGIAKQKLTRLRKGNNIDRITVYKIIVLLALNINQAIEFMTLCGITFCPFRKEEMIIMKYLTGQYKNKVIKGLYDLNNLIFDETGLTIFVKEEKENE